ncbi:MAG TPA: AAA family ATPase [Pseudonocardiaceae bacterium]|nr:AAA family ATPase [Pseudonocardiaceae bacterium]
MTEDSAAGAESFRPGLPAFVNEIAGTLAVHSQYVLHGNLRDYFMVAPPGGRARPMSLLPLLWQAIQPRGYECIICYDPVDGITVHPKSVDAQNVARELLGQRVIGRRPALQRLRTHLAKVVGVPVQPPPEGDPGPVQPMAGAPQPPAQPPQPAPPDPKPAETRPPVRAAFVIDYAARITRVPGQLDPDERDFFLYCQKLAFTAGPVARDEGEAELFNPILWLVEGERDLPAWLTAGVDPIRTIAVGMPTLGDRETLAESLVPGLPAPGQQTEEALTKAKEQFAKRTDGMTLRSMTEIARLSVDRGIPADRVADAVRIYKLGVDDNPWRHDSVRQHIIDGEKVVLARVIGQDRAVGKTLDILKRAALGLSGAQATSTKARPRGVLFFAGPTGVGKTELAKQVAELLFGDVDAYLRFDMSEFAADHAADRLIGAPPGYVGFEAGGELTGAVRRNPFQVVLFDEIEKAHKLVLDKFLQILEDGRLTDGQGITTYFSECVIIFTSNLGIIATDTKTGERQQLVHPGMAYPELEATVRAAVREHFTTQLGRPELLNRLGDNIVVFDFIGKDAAERICGLQLSNIVDTVERELEIALQFSDEARKQLAATCTADSANGGRGIGNLLESNLVNPLARLLFAENTAAGSTVMVTSVRPGSATLAPELAARVTHAGQSR